MPCSVRVKITAVVAEGKKKVGCFKNGMPTHSGEENFRLTIELSAKSHN
jgi:hypothetical protein